LIGACPGKGTKAQKRAHIFDGEISTLAISGGQKRGKI